MKKGILFILFMGLISLGVMAQGAAANAKAVIATPGVHCDYCKKRIEMWVGKQEGVISIKVDVKSKTTEVVWNKDRANIEFVKTYISNIGYDADDVMAEKTAYDRLPKACQVKTTPFDPE